MPEERAQYITTTLPYVNSDPHVGFAMEIVRADVLARYKKSQGHEVFFNTGTDEHGAKIFEAAKNAGVETKAYVDGLAKKFEDLIKILNISSDINFIRTTDGHHKKAAQKMWMLCKENGDIYKKLYRIKYCIGCELEKTESDLENEVCPLHPKMEIEIREEENYFFRWSNYQEKLLEFYKENPQFVIPDFRFNETKAFVEAGLEDFSVSRLKAKMPWGIEVPDDSEHVMYVWFDALTNYISTLGWPENTENFEKFWKNGNPIQYCGKDNNRQQSAMWQAMLMSAGLPNTKHIVINGFITSGGQKMSKSLGNVISPFDVVEMFKGVTDFPEDVLRFVLLHDISSFEDSDLTIESIKESYRAHLQNGLGNLVSRIMKLSEQYQVKTLIFDNNVHSGYEGMKSHLDNFEISRAVEIVWGWIQRLDKKIAEEKPYEVIKSDPVIGKAQIQFLVAELFYIAKHLALFMPETSKKIIELIKENKMPEKALFARID